jgi:putative transposase
MSRFRLYPEPAQEAVLLSHCAHARFVWNLALEQQQLWRPGRKTPGLAEQSRQLTEARAEFDWLSDGSVTVQQQALRDFAQAMANFFRGTHRRPKWRKAGIDEGFRIVGSQGRRVERLSKRMGRVLIPKAGWVKFRWSRAVADAKSYRVTRDRVGRWHVAFAVIPDAVSAPGNAAMVGVDRGVAVSAALSTGELLHVPGLAAKESERLLRLQRRLAKAQKGSKRRARLKAQIARIRGRAKDRRKDWVEKLSTRLAREFDLIGIERLDTLAMSRSARGTVERPGTNVRQKASLNRRIRENGWGLIARRLHDKAPGRTIEVPAAYTSQACNRCGHVDPKNRESQAAFRCTACGRRDHADVNAAKNIRDIAAGHAVTARGGVGLPKPVNREPHLAAH